MIPLKSICIPGSPPLDVSELLPLIDHPLFQKLRRRTQLGVNSLVFPGAVHTRFEHALGVLALTQRFLRLHAVPDEDDRKGLAAFALLHDIGHGPFSHQIEPIIGGSHHERGLVCVAAMRAELEQCGVDLERLAAMFRGEHPCAQYVTDRNLGTDKLDYLMRDALHIGFPGTPDIERVQAFTTVDEGCLAIEEKFIEDIKRVQKFYSYLHQHGYLNKTALSAQRLLQRAVEEELFARADDPTSLWNMTDHDLLEWLRHGRSPLAAKLATRLDTRAIHRTVLAIRPDGYGFAERRSRKEIAVLEWPLLRLRRFTELCNGRGQLRRLENELAAHCRLDAGDVLFAAMPYFRKLIPQNVRIYSRSEEGSFWLFDKDRDHKRSLDGDYLRTFAIRVTVVPEHRHRAAAICEAIAAFLKGLVKP